MQKNLDSSFEEEPQQIQSVPCQQCLQKDRMIDKYVRLVHLQRQKINRRSWASKTTSSSNWFSAIQRKNQLCDSLNFKEKFARTADTSANTWMSNLDSETKKSSFAGSQYENIQKNDRNSAFKFEDSTLKLLRKSQKLVETLTLKIYDLKSEILHIRSTTYNLIKSLDIKNNSKININTSCILDVLISTFEYSEQEKLEMLGNKSKYQQFQHKPKGLWQYIFGLT